MKVDFSKMDLQTLIEEHNPFAFKDVKRKICFFENFSGAYLALLERLFEQFPKGYIDMVLFVVDNCDMEHEDACRFVDNMKKAGYKLNPSVIDWYEGGLERDKMLKSIAIGMHDISETSFNEGLFMAALNMFMVKYKIFK